ncbi:hypothetical protein [Paenibacillus glufosinatiresistens]|uniref:hypothetical protein n=1 Tax=Paenibacillus glufosinatiresistens TaxID=3070657 RepID=UPI00286E0673|nr:hypothetical protein [Paenibacillus sp. YX.27]
MKGEKMNSEYCNVCGLKLDEIPSSFDICPCCGVMWGYEDNNKRSLIKFREKWIEEGCNWFDEEERPNKWDAKAQLAQIGIKI